jgi:hypothetical protein
MGAPSHHNISRVLSLRFGFGFGLGLAAHLLLLAEEPLGEVLGDVDVGDWRQDVANGTAGSRSLAFVIIHIRPCSSNSLLRTLN